jgi:hypothetical protein
MDELVAATAACDMATDANAPKDLEQRSVCGTVGAGVVDILNVEATAKDKENNNVHAAAQDPEDVVSKVSLDPQMLFRATCTPPLTR